MFYLIEKAKINSKHIMQKSINELLIEFKILYN